MISVNVDIKNLNTLRRNFDRAPATALKYLSRATKAAIAEIEKRADDSGNGGLFQFKTPRGQRTGYLALSFSFGRYIAPSGLYASIGPTAHYAPHVYFGTSRGIKPNKYMDRIAKDAEPDINDHFEKAVDLFVKDLADV